MSVDNELPTLLSVPSPFAQELVDTLLPHAVVKTYPARRKLIISSAGVHFCYLISKGKFELHREQDDVVIVFWQTPAVLGLGNFTNMYYGTYIRTLTSCEIGILSTGEALELIEKYNLWKTLAQHLLVVTAKLYTVSQQLSAPRTYDVIRTQLLEYICEDDDLRSNTTIESYIRSKTNLSRSGIMKILLSLKSGGYIEIERGKLIKINSLPKRY